MRRRDLLSMYSSALAELVLSSLCGAVLIIMALQFLAALFGAFLDSTDALLLVWQSLVLLGLWPGQRYWTIQRTNAKGIRHSVIGVPSEDDEIRLNRIAARQRAQQPQQR
ncbi:MAG: hypothetical protein AAGA74_10775 [Pseudomonadota bacterium]